MDKADSSEDVTVLNKETINFLQHNLDSNLSSFKPDKNHFRNIKNIGQTLMNLIKNNVETEIWEEVHVEVVHLIKGILYFSKKFFKAYRHACFVLWELLQQIITSLETKHSSVKSQLVRKLTPPILKIICYTDNICTWRNEWLSVMFYLLNGVDSNSLDTVIPKISKHLLHLCKLLVSCGDYRTQELILESMFHYCTTGEERLKLLELYVDDLQVIKTFKDVTLSNFYDSSRIFLNELNGSYGDNSEVISVPCKFAFIGSVELKKPLNSTLKEFWVDFNLGSQSVSLKVDSSWAIGTIDSSSENPKCDIITIYSFNVRKCTTHVRYHHEREITRELVIAVEEPFTSLLVSSNEALSLSKDILIVFPDDTTSDKIEHLLPLVFPSVLDPAKNVIRPSSKRVSTSSSIPVNCTKGVKVNESYEDVKKSFTSDPNSWNNRLWMSNKDSSNKNRNKQDFTDELLTVGVNQNRTECYQDINQTAPSKHLVDLNGVSMKINSVTDPSSKDNCKLNSDQAASAISKSHQNLNETIEVNIDQDAKTCSLQSILQDWNSNASAESSFRKTDLLSSSDVIKDNVCKLGIPNAEIEQRSYYHQNESSDQTFEEIPQSVKGHKVVKSKLDQSELSFSDRKKNKSQRYSLHSITSEKNDSTSKEILQKCDENGVFQGEPDPAKQKPKQCSKNVPKNANRQKISAGNNNVSVQNKLRRSDCISAKDNIECTSTNLGEKQNVSVSKKSEMKNKNVKMEVDKNVSKTTDKNVSKTISSKFTRKNMGKNVNKNLKNTNVSTDIISTSVVSEHIDSKQTRHKKKSLCGVPITATKSNKIKHKNNEFYFIKEISRKTSIQKDVSDSLAADVKENSCIVTHKTKEARGNSSMAWEKSAINIFNRNNNKKLNYTQNHEDLKASIEKHMENNLPQVATITDKTERILHSPQKEKNRLNNFQKMFEIPDERVHVLKNKPQEDEKKLKAEVNAYRIEDNEYVRTEESPNILFQSLTLSTDGISEQNICNNLIDKDAKTCSLQSILQDWNSNASAESSCRKTDLLSSSDVIKDNVCKLAVDSSIIMEENKDNHVAFHCSLPDTSLVKIPVVGLKTKKNIDQTVELSITDFVDTSAKKLTDISEHSPKQVKTMNYVQQNSIEHENAIDKPVDNLVLDCCSPVQYFKSKSEQHSAPSSSKLKFLVKPIRHRDLLTNQVKVRNLNETKTVSNINRKKDPDPYYDFEDLDKEFDIDSILTKLKCLRKSKNLKAKKSIDSSYYSSVNKKACNTHKRNKKAGIEKEKIRGQKISDDDDDNDGQTRKRKFVSIDKGKNNQKKKSRANLPPVDQLMGGMNNDLEISELPSLLVDSNRSSKNNLASSRSSSYNTSRNVCAQLIPNEVHPSGLDKEMSVLANNVISNISSQPHVTLSENISEKGSDDELYLSDTYDKMHSGNAEMRKTVRENDSIVSSVLCRLSSEQNPNKTQINQDCLYENSSEFGKSKRGKQTNMELSGIEPLLSNCSSASKPGDILSLTKENSYEETVYKESEIETFSDTPVTYTSRQDAVILLQGTQKKRRQSYLSEKKSVCSKSLKISRINQMSNNLESPCGHVQFNSIGPDVSYNNESMDDDDDNMGDELTKSLKHYLGTQKPDIMSSSMSSISSPARDCFILETTEEVNFYKNNLSSEASAGVGTNCFGELGHPTEDIFTPVQARIQDSIIRKMAVMKQLGENVDGLLQSSLENAFDIGINEKNSYLKEKYQSFFKEIDILKKCFDKMEESENKILVLENYLKCYIRERNSMFEEILVRLNKLKESLTVNKEVPLSSHTNTSIRGMNKELQKLSQKNLNLEMNRYIKLASLKMKINSLI